MTVMRKKLIIVVLLVVFGSGAMAGTATAINACPQKKPCCTPVVQQIMDHSTPMMMGHGIPMEMDDQRGCAPAKHSTCCELKSDPNPIELAISSASNFDLSRIIIGFDAPGLVSEASRSQTNINAYPDDRLLKIPIVPIYLQTLSILC